MQLDLQLSTWSERVRRIFIAEFSAPLADAWLMDSAAVCGSGSGSGSGSGGGGGGGGGGGSGGNSD